MTNASAKKTASQNEAAIKRLRLGTFIPTLLFVLCRLILRKPIIQSKSALAVYIALSAPGLALSRHLELRGNPKRDAKGLLISMGDDLNQPGVTEWSFDVIYVTWLCQTLSGLFGMRVWWLYLAIPIFALYKAYTTVFGPLFAGRANSPAPGATTAQPSASTSKRQEKLRKRSERGDSRVQMKQK